MKLWKFTVANILPSLKEIKFRVVLSVVLLFVTTAMQIIAIESGRSVLKSIRFMTTGAAEPNLILDYLHRLGLTLSGNIFIESGLISLAAFTLSYFLIYFRDFIFETVAERVIHSLRCRVFSHIIRLPYLTFLQYNPGVLTKRLFSDAALIRMLVMEIGLLRIADVIMLIGMAAYLATLHLYLALITFAFAALYFFVSTFTSVLAKNSMKHADTTNEAAQAYSVEAFNNLVAIRANLRENSEGQKFKGYSFSYHSAMLSLAKVLTFDKILSNYLSSLGPILILFLGGFFIISGSLSYETLVIFSIALGFLISPINNLTLIPMRIRRISLAAENMDTFMNLPLEGAGREPGLLLDAAGGGSAPLISLKDVSFAYPKSNRTLSIKDVSVPRGTFTAVLSPSGYGKTTIMRLLFGLIDTYKGEIRLAGTDIRRVPLDELRGHISYLPQENYVFAGTVMENLLYGAAENDKEGPAKAVEALKKVRLYDEVMRMPKGLDTPIEYMGRNLSGGQIRRLCLARVIMKAPVVLILDEPFTGLHAEDQGLILTTLKQLSGVTILMITHQLEYARYANKIIELTLEKREAAVPGTAPAEEEVLAAERTA